jgi:LuxR family transcriptional regulator, maltose regulon positive regulatory protein
LIQAGSTLASLHKPASAMLQGKSTKADAGGRGLVLATKLGPPRLRPSELISRKALMAKLARALDVSLTIIAAPAGYGKSTALGEWYQGIDAARTSAAWLTVDESDDDPILFASDLIAAIELGVPAMRGKLSAAMNFRMDIDLRATAAAIVNAVEACGEHVVMLIDDLHAVSNPDVLDLIERLANSGSRWLHLIVSSRTQPKFRLAKLRTLGSVVEFGAKDLQCDREEARDFLTRGASEHIDEDVLDQIFARTEGWAAGLRLASLSLRGHDRPVLPQMLSGAGLGIDDFLRDEVLARLPASIAEFVVDAAVIGEFSAELCDAVLVRRDSANLIEELEARQLFISRVGESGWFRFHQLFVDAVEAIGARKSIDRTAELHQRAANWFEAKGYPGRALRHAFAAGDPEFSAKVLDHVCTALVQTGRGATLVKYAAALPQELLADYPELQLERVYSLTLTWQFSDASRILRDVRASLTNGARNAKWASQGLDIDRLIRKQIYCELQLAILRDEMVRAEGLARQWLTIDGGYSFYDDAVTQTSLIYAQREQFNCQTVAASGRAREIFVNNGNRWGTIWHDCIVGAGYAQAGNLARAQSIYEGAFSTALEVVGRTNPITAIPALHLAEVLYEIDDVQGAQQLIEEFLPLATQTGLVDQLVAGYQTKVRIAALQSTQSALRVLDEGEEISIAREFERLHAFLIADRVRILAADGENAEVRRVGLINNLASSLDTYNPAKGQTTVAAARAFAAAHLALVENNLNGADALLRRWMRFFEDHGCARFGIRFAVLLAHVQILTGDTKVAHRTLRTALTWGAKGGFVRSFLDANPAVRTQLEHMQLSPMGSDAETVAFQQRILLSLSGSARKAGLRSLNVDDLGGQYDALNDRESEILLMISTGMMNSQIAEESGLTLGTVKWYLQQVYGKLGVNRRSEAVFKARQLGLIG